MKKYFLIGVFSVLLATLYVNAQVKINEVVPKGANYAEWVELYNTNSSPVSLDGWKIYLYFENGSFDLTGRSIAGNGYDTLDVSSVGLENSGDIIVLTNSSNDTVDQIGFGFLGGAPVAPYPNFSLARIKDGLDMDDDARDFNLDGTPTPEAPNNPDTVLLGSSVIINEIRPYPSSGPDSVEIYNPTGITIYLQNWLLSDGDAVSPIVTDVSVSPSGYLVLEEGTDWTVSMDFASEDVCYLFRDDSVRVDQLGWYGEYNDFSFQRYPDGEGPNDGYDWISSGGGVTLFDVAPTWGGANTSGIEEDIPYGHNLIVPGFAKGKISIQYAIPVKTDVTISIVDGIGRLVSVLVDEEQKPGYYAITVEKDNLPSGLYFVIMESPLFIKTEKFMFIR
jgi:hypothetical protein